MKRLVLKSVLAGFVCGLLIVSVTQTKRIILTSDIFAVKTVEVRGAVHADPLVLKEIYSAYVGDNIFTDIPADTTHTKDEWVLKLAVKRALPDKLVVLVEEEEELIRYKDARYKDVVGCMALTGTGKHIPVGCDGVSVTVAALPLASEFASFAELYRKNEFLQNSAVVIKNGFFTVSTGEEVLLATYLPAVFEDNFDRYTKQIKNRYKQIEKVDLTIPGKIYVKGVIRG
jgi:cell division protein FtsQ